MITSEGTVNFQSGFETATLKCLDFDGTIADTLTPSPNNIDVATGYRIAIEEVFGLQSLRHYFQGGGLKNRAPIEIVQQLAPDATDDEQYSLLTQLDTAKLAVLVSEIGPSWPRPVPGFEHFTHALNAARRAGILIDTAITSSGHHPFISRTFQTWGIFEPTIILAQEAILTMAKSRGEAMPVKPDRRIFGYATQLWRDLYGMTGPLLPTDDERKRISYVGDGDVDAQFAHNAGIPFFRIQAASPKESWSLVAEQLESLHAA